MNLLIDRRADRVGRQSGVPRWPTHQHFDIPACLSNYLGGSDLDTEWKMQGSRRTVLASALFFNHSVLDTSRSTTRAVHCHPQKDGWNRTPSGACNTVWKSSQVHVCSSTRWNQTWITARLSCYHYTPCKRHSRCQQTTSGSSVVKVFRDRSRWLYRTTRCQRASTICSSRERNCGGSHMDKHWSRTLRPWAFAKVIDYNGDSHEIMPELCGWGALLEIPLG